MLFIIRFNEIRNTKSGTYECAISVYDPCTYKEFIFVSDQTGVYYIFAFYSFIMLQALTNFIYYLIFLYQSNRRKGIIIKFFLGIVLLVLLGYLSIPVSFYLDYYLSILLRFFV